MSGDDSTWELLLGLMDETKRTTFVHTLARYIPEDGYAEAMRAARRELSRPTPTIAGASANTEASISTNIQENTRASLQQRRPHPASLTPAPTEAGTSTPHTIPLVHGLDTSVAASSSSTTHGGQGGPAPPHVVKSEPRDGDPSVPAPHRLRAVKEERQNDANDGEDDWFQLIEDPTPQRKVNGPSTSRVVAARPVPAPPVASARPTRQAVPNLASIFDSSTDSDGEENASDDESEQDGHDRPLAKRIKIGDQNRAPKKAVNDATIHGHELVILQVQARINLICREAKTFNFGRLGIIRFRETIVEASQNLPKRGLNSRILPFMTSDAVHSFFKAHTARLKDKSPRFAKYFGKC